VLYKIARSDRELFKRWLILVALAEKYKLEIYILEKVKLTKKNVL